MAMIPIASSENSGGARKNPGPMRRTVPLKMVLLDLNHTTKGLHTSTMPLGIGLLASYLLENLPKGSIEVQLYKFADDLSANLDQNFDLVGFSMYSWNSNLNRFFAERIKRNNPKAVVVCGGPDINYSDNWIRGHLLAHPFINYLVPFNGEIPLLNIVRAEVFDLGDESNTVEGAYYLAGSEQKLIYKELLTKLDSLNAAPSPYLSGLMDKFFPTSQSPFKLAPFVETNRGCPYQCTFCHTANEKYNKLIYKVHEVFRAEMELFAERMTDYPDIPLYIADNNFGMFNRDNEIADIIRAHQDASNWPVFIDVTVGKSRVENILQVVKKLKPGTLSVFMSAQSMTPVVLKNIKRKNLSPDAFQYLQHGLMDASKDQPSSQQNLSSSVIIIGLPGETRQSFFDTVEKIMEMGINSFIPYTLMVLKGTPLGDEIYEQQSEYTIRHRIVPQQFGRYDGHLVLDTEEVAVGTPTMTHDDYLECRALCFFLQVVYGNDLFQSHIQLLRKHSCNVFRWILDIMATVRGDTGKLGQLFQSFYADTKGELWESEEAVRTFFDQDDNYNALVDGKYGANLMAKYTFLSRMECFAEWIDVVSRTTRVVLMEKMDAGSEKEEVGKFLDEYRDYCLRVKNIASFFDDGFEAAPFAMRLRYDFSKVDLDDILMTGRDPIETVFEFSDTAKAIISNTKKDSNWRYKLQQLIRIKNAAENIYPKATTAAMSSTDCGLGEVERDVRDQSWRL
jgi:radical SAM superfamily enzyme YgiQ (UPF0313 family)